MADKYSSPYQVLERGNKAWKLQVGERVEVVSRNRLKPHLDSVAPRAAVLQTRGRPRTVSQSQGHKVMRIYPRNRKHLRKYLLYE